MIDPENERVICTSCGSKYNFSDFTVKSDIEQLEKIRIKQRQQKEQDRLNHIEKERKAAENAAREDAADYAAARSFKNGALKIFLILFIIFFVFGFMVAYNDGRVISTIISAVQIILFLLAYLCGTRILKLPRGIHIVFALIGFLLIFPYFNFYSSSGNSASSQDTGEEFIWSAFTLSEYLPEPSSNTGRVFSDDSDELDIYILEISYADYQNYLSACKEYGFTIDAEQSSNGYEAYNESNYFLNLYYYSSSDRLDIELTAPETLTTLTWPTSGLATLIPQPDSGSGSIVTDSASKFHVYVGDITYDAYTEYVSQCMESGFTVDYNKEDRKFTAKNKKGISLTVIYEGVDLMEITVNDTD